MKQQTLTGEVKDSTDTQTDENTSETEMRDATDDAADVDGDSKLYSTNPNMLQIHPREEFRTGWEIAEKDALREKKSRKSRYDAGYSGTTVSDDEVLDYLRD